MTVATEQSSIQFVGIIDGVPLAIPFPVQATSDLKVYHHGSTLAVEGVDYSVALVAPDYLTASVTPLPGFAVTSAGNVTVQREVTYTQPTNLVLSPTLMLSRLTQMVDRTVFLAQQLRDKLGNALSYQVADPAASKGALPLKANRASKFLAFDVNGNPIAAAGPTASGTPLTAFGNAWTQLMAVADALVYLGFTTVGATGKAVVAATTAVQAQAAMAAAGLTADNVFTGNNTAPTQLAGDASARLATDAFVQAAVGKVTLQIFTASGTYTPSAGMVRAIILAQGAGGGGAGCGNPAASAFNSAGSGGAGELAIKLVTAADVGASQVVTIGAKGTKGSAGLNDATAGGDTSVGALCIGKGGAQGTPGAGGVGGTLGTGDLLIPGMGGAINMNIGATGASGSSLSSPGGSSKFGAGGKAQLGPGIGDAAVGRGAGGGGASSFNGGGAFAGGDGAPGIVFIIEFRNQ